MRRYRLDRDGRELLSATSTGWGWKGYPILEGGIPVASVRVRRPFFPTPWQPGGIVLRFEPRTGLCRGPIVAFSGFLTPWAQVPQWPVGLSRASTAPPTAA